jgi:hypothetical protein
LAAKRLAAAARLLAERRNPVEMRNQFLPNVAPLRASPPLRGSFARDEILTE